MKMAIPTLLITVVMSALLLGAFATNAPCKEGDFGTFFTPCASNSRSQISYPKVDCCTTCQGAASLPANSYNIPCSCDSGQERTYQGACSDCHRGSFAPGGVHYNAEDWKIWGGICDNEDSSCSPEPGVLSYCEGEDCSKWQMSFDGESFYSGNNSLTSNIAASLMIVKSFDSSNNSISFQYRVDAEYCTSGCDGLTFFIDGARVLPPEGVKPGHISIQPQYKQFIYPSAADPPLQNGLHVLRWMYEKDYSKSSGEDAAFISSITLRGALQDDGSIVSECNPCPPGTYSSEDRASECILCGWFEYQPASNSTSCLTCDEGKFSSPGSSTCVNLQNCTTDEIISVRTPLAMCNTANNYTYGLRYSWASMSTETGEQRAICQANDLTLPQDLDSAGPCTCAPGLGLRQHSSKGATCASCTDATFSDGTFPFCQNCANNTIPIKGHGMIDWSEGFPSTDDCSSLSPGAWCSYCDGDCPSPGWIPAGSYASTGRSFGSYRSSLFLHVDATENSQLSFTCQDLCVKSQGVSAPSSECSLTMILTNSSSEVTSMDCYSYVATRSYLFTEPGEYTIEFKFVQLDALKTFNYEGRIYNISIDRTASGGNIRCDLCPSGSRFDSTTLSCLPCDAGFESTSPPSDTCVPCQQGSFSSKVGQMCTPCGAGTTSKADRTGCDLHGCMFRGNVTSATYDLSKLGNDGGEMVVAVSGSRTGSDTSLFYLNPCYTHHITTECFDSTTNSSLPYMACQVTGGGVYDIGSVMGVTEVALGRLIMELNYGTMCATINKPRRTRVQLVCDLQGSGIPTRLPGKYSFETGLCLYEMMWYSPLACPVCEENDYNPLRGPCTDGKQVVSYAPARNCSGTKPSITVPCKTPMLDDIPEEGLAYIIATARTTHDITTDQYPEVVSTALDGALPPYNVTVFSVKNLVFTFRLTVVASMVANWTTLLQETLNDEGTPVGILEGSLRTVVYEPASEAANDKDFVVVGFVIVGVLLIVSIVLMYKNRQLKYQNYRLLNTGGGRNGHLALELDNEDEDRNVLSGTAVKYNTKTKHVSSPFDDDEDL